MFMYNSFKFQITIMKTISLLSTIFFLCINSFSSQAQKTTQQETIKIWGNCGMCKKTIETAAKSAGATTADWNDDTKIMAVTYAISTTSSDKIQKAIATAGYDTEKFTADQKAYDKLHSCCQYDRKGTTAATTEKTDCCKEGKCAAHLADCCVDGKCEKNAASCCKEGKCSADQACGKEKTCCKS